MAEKFDAIVVGGGHNGLVAAGYLQRAGLSTLVLEKRHVVGGACVTEEVFPGFKVSTTSYVCSLFRPEIINDLELKKFGYEVIERNPSSFSPFPDGSHLMFWRDQKKTCAEIAKFSKKDALQFPLFEKRLEELSRFVQPLLDAAPPDPTSNSLENMWSSLKLGLRVRALGPDLYEHLRVFSMSVADYLSQWFESEAIRVRMATDGVIGAWAGPYSPGTAYVLFHHVMGETKGQPGVWGYIRGGMGTITQSLSKSFESRGGKVMTSAEVSSIKIKNGQAVGVELKDGREFYGKTILSGCDPHVTFLKLIAENELPKYFVENIRRIRMKSGVVKINLALGELPNFTSLPGEGVHHRGTIHLAPTLEYMETAFDDAKHGMPSKRPVIEMTIPSTVDNSLAPPGKHVMSMFVQYAPYTRKDGKAWNDETRRDFATSVFNVVEEYAPGFTRTVEGCQVLTPVDLEREFGLTGGNIFHGEMTLDQLFFMRPTPGFVDSTTPIKNLHLCGSGIHPGGGVMGSPGLIAARKVLKSR